MDFNKIKALEKFAKNRNKEIHSKYMCDEKELLVDTAIRKYYSDIYDGGVFKDDEALSEEEAKFLIAVGKSEKKLFANYENLYKTAIKSVIRDMDKELNAKEDSWQYALLFFNEAIEKFDIEELVILGPYASKALISGFQENCMKNGLNKSSFYNYCLIKAYEKMFYDSTGRFPTDEEVANGVTFVNNKASYNTKVAYIKRLRQPITKITSVKKLDKNSTEEMDMLDFIDRVTPQEKTEEVDSNERKTRAQNIISAFSSLIQENFTEPSKEYFFSNFVKKNGSLGKKEIVKLTELIGANESELSKDAIEFRKEFLEKIKGNESIKKAFLNLYEEDN